MPTKQVNYRNDKAVLMKVYVEKSKKKRSSKSSIQQHHHHHHHHHYHHMVAQEVIDGSNGNSNKGYYDRRSRLLMYSRMLRNSARGGASPNKPLLPKYSQNNNIQIPTQMNSSKKKPKHAGTPSCFGNWKLLIPSFLRSRSNEQKKEKKKQIISGNGYKKLQVNKGKGFIPKVFSMCKCA